MSSNVFMNNQLERIADYIDAGKAGGGSLTVNLSGVGDMTGASAGAAGAHGLVPAPAAGDQDKVLTGAGTWVDLPASGGVNYSTSEQDTGFTWIDGSEIFQKTVVFSSLTAGAQTLQHGISGVDTIIDAEGIVICNDASNYVLMMNYPEFAPGWYASLGFINQTTIDIRMGANMISSYPNLEAYITIRFTKI